MAFTFRPPRASVGLLIGLSGSNGSNKIHSAPAREASPMTRRSVIDTEAGRSRHYSDRRFDVGDLTPPFTPDRYAGRSPPWTRSIR